MRLNLTSIVFVMLAMTACGEEATTAGEAGEVNTGPAQITNSINVVDWADGSPIAGAQLCSNIDGQDCQISNANGNASFTFTANEGDQLQLRVSKAGYFSFILETECVDLVDGGMIETSWFMSTTTMMTELASVAGTAPAAEKGQATVQVFGPADNMGERYPLAGVTVSLDGTAEVGPKQLNPTEDFAMSGPFSSGNVTTAAGLSAFFNVAPGAVDVTATLEGYVCRPGLAGLPSGSATVSGNVEANHVTYFTVFCDFGSK